MLDIIILAAGKGTRMHSNKPKVLHTIAGKPFISHVIDRSLELNADSINVVVGFGGDQLREALTYENLNFIEQKEQLGTGHAVQQAIPNIHPEATVLILYGDVPLIEADTLRQLESVVSDKSMGLLTVHLDNPLGYGRIVRNRIGSIEAIVEQKDADKEQLEIKEINTGVMALKGEYLLKWLPQLKNNNAQGEFYLTDIIAMAHADEIEVRAAHPNHEYETMGVNNRKQQAELERIYQDRYANLLMGDGVTILDPKRIDCRGEISAGKDCIIDVNCVFEGNVELGNNVKIGPNCFIKNMKIGDNTEIFANCFLEDGIIEDSALIGPFARMRPECNIASGAKLGNFVEVKKSRIGPKSKVNHFTYVGDSEVGERVNIGAGTITCNYDGAKKHKTIIKDDVFIGSNTAIVAPATIGNRVTIGAGSIVTDNAEDDQLVVARARQSNIDGWKRPKKDS